MTKEEKDKRRLVAVAACLKKVLEDVGWQRDPNLRNEQIAKRLWRMAWWLMPDGEFEALHDGDEKELADINEVELKWLKQCDW